MLLNLMDINQEKRFEAFSSGDFAFVRIKEIIHETQIQIAAEAITEPVV